MAKHLSSVSLSHPYRDPQFLFFLTLLPHWDTSWQHPDPHTHTYKRTHALWTKSPEVEASTMSLSSIGLHVVTAHSVLLTCLLCSVILLTEGPPQSPVHPVQHHLPPVCCGPSVIPSPILHPHIRPVLPCTPPKQTSCLGLSCPRGRKQVPRGPRGLSMWHTAARSSSLLLQPANTPERQTEWCVLQLWTWLLPQMRSCWWLQPLQVSHWASNVNICHRTD